MDDAVFYKVVKRKNDDLLSCVVASSRRLVKEGLCLTYQPGIPTTGEHGPILIFDTLENAHSFVGRGVLSITHAEIWSCEAKGASEVSHVLDLDLINFDKESVRRWWESGARQDWFFVAMPTPFGISAPTGTYAAYTITLLEKVWPRSKGQEGDEKHGR
jgi:hypothetical protein